MAQPIGSEPPSAQPGKRPPLRVHPGGKQRTSVGRQPPELPDPGTRVVLHTSKGPIRGVVMPYDKQWSHGSFPVRFDFGAYRQWRVMNARDVTLDEEE